MKQEPLFSPLELQIQGKEGKKKEATNTYRHWMRKREAQRGLSLAQAYPSSKWENQDSNPGNF